MHWLSRMCNNVVLLTVVSILIALTGCAEPQAEVEKAPGQYEVGRVPEDVAFVEKTLEVNPKDAEAYYNIGEDYALEDNEKAIKAYQQAIKIDQNHASAYGGLGLCYGAMKNYKKSVNSYNKSIEIDPYNADTQLGIGDSYAALGQSPEATNAYSKAAMIYISWSQREDAISAFKAALKVASNEKQIAQINIEVGTLFEEINRFEEGLEAYKNAIKTLSDDYFKQIIYKKIAKILIVKLNRYEDAIEPLKKAIHIFPQDSILYTWLGNCYARLQRHQEAVDAYDQAIKIEPDDHQTLSFMGRCYNMLGDYQKAKDCLEKACKLTDYKNHEYMAALAFVYAENGNFDKAVEYQSKAIELADDKIKIEHEKRLETYKAHKPWRE